MSNENKRPNKMDQAVARARGANGSGSETMALTEADVGTLDVSLLPAGMLVSSDTVKAELAAKIASGEWEQAPQLLSLKEGQTLIAHLEGNGAPAEFADEHTGIVSEEQTWVLSRDGVRVSILGTAQLNKKLPPFVGGIVSVTRGKDVRNGTKIYTEYLVMGPKRADGSPRDWSTRPLLTAGPSEVVS